MTTPKDEKGAEPAPATFEDYWAAYQTTLLASQDSLTPKQVFELTEATARHAYACGAMSVRATPPGELDSARDTERLNWLSENGTTIRETVGFYLGYIDNKGRPQEARGITLRDAIDAASLA
jgi:hypothetical protein